VKGLWTLFRIGETEDVNPAKFSFSLRTRRVMMGF
jgi:hypothetical protein